jgi:cyanocobalamin reductase (cyanide-eliminating) / alkylcobalamin dealkylase
VNAGLAPGERLAPARDEGDLGLLVASTRYFWLRFGASLAEEPTRALRPHPVDEHTEAVVAAALAPLETAWTVRFAHDSPPLPVQRIADLAGFARLSPARLSVHPVYGPWIALRAVAVVGVPGPALGPSPAPDPCPGCPGGCADAFARAVEASRRPDAGSVARTWSAWLAVRDACPVGRAHRYSADQILYGYTKDRGILERLAREGSTLDS